MGDKATAKSTMIAAGVPRARHRRSGHGPAVAKKEAKKIGYPVILKATAGGGGKGMRLVWKEEEFQEAFEKASQEAGAAFGNAGMVAMEKYILEPRHIEIRTQATSTARSAT